MRVLLDTDVVSDSEFAEVAEGNISARWRGTHPLPSITGYRRKQPHKDPERQLQIEALFTVGRLIREGKVEAYTYEELLCEHGRGRARIQEFNALRGCKIKQCDPALERSRFSKTNNLLDGMAKGGKKDRKKGIKSGGATQLGFFKWLSHLSMGRVAAVISIAAKLGLSEFEVESLRHIDWFQFLCQRSQSEENYPDVFHLWTAERNNLDAMLTLERKLPNLVSRVRNEKIPRIVIRTEALRPLNLLERLGIKSPDPVPMRPDHFYELAEALADPYNASIR